LAGYRLFSRCSSSSSSGQLLFDVSIVETQRLVIFGLLLLLLLLSAGDLRGHGHDMT
jgi:hypothetical protein